jgi:eukaryotic-like serine/threonine-protein kinase
MADKPRAEVSTGKLEEERLAHALVSRGLITKEEVEASRSATSTGAGVEGFLQRVVAKGFLTANQARRAAKELQTLLGQQIPGFLLQDKVGQGSMGTVYKALQVSMNRVVAVKILHPKLAANADLLAGLTREAHVVARLSHNNIVQAIDVGAAGPLHYLVMEFIEGKTIKQEIEAGKKRYEEKEAIEIILQIAQALQHAHRRGLVHRDVKPANIVLTTEGIAKLADLGMARQTSDQKVIRKERGLAIGTPYYMSPEQVRGEDDIDGRADIYALGATFYHMVTGQPPFPSKDIDAVLQAHMEQELTPPDHLNQALSSGLGEVVEIMMAKDRNQRYRNADDLIIDLECLLAGEPPKLARKKIQASTLQGLAEGDEDDEGEQGRLRGLPWLWVGVMGGGLGLSLLFNLILLLRSRG